MLAAIASSRRLGLARLRGAFGSSSAAGRACSTQASEEPRSLFVANVEGRRNTSPILLGLFEHFETLVGPRVGFFQPIAGEPFTGGSGGKPGAPRHVELLRAAFGLRDEPGAMVGVSRRDTVQLLAAGREEELLERISDRYEAHARGKAMMLIEGTHRDGPINTPGSRLELNARLAASLAAPFLLLMDARTDGAEVLQNRARICQRAAREQRARVLGLLVNQVQPPDRLAPLAAALREGLQPGGPPLLGCLPHSPLLASRRLGEVQRALGAAPLQAGGQQGRLDVGVDQVVAAAGTLDSCLAELAAAPPERRSLAVVDASRSDVLLGLAAAHGSVAGPHPAGLLVCEGGGALNPRVLSILQGGGPGGSQLPLLTTHLSSTQALQTVAGITPSLLPSSARKIEEAKALVAAHTDLAALDAALEAPREEAVTPKRFTRAINATCTARPQRIVLPEGAEPRVLRAAAEVCRRGLAALTLLGEPGVVAAEARRAGVDVSGCEVVDHRSSPRVEAYAELLVEARRHKGMTLEKARDLLLDANYFGTLMAASGDADGMVSGSTSTTAATIRPALQVLKSKGALVSSVFFMCLPTNVLVYGDCAVNTDPGPQELAQIGITSADTAAAFGIPPRVAFLSYSTLGSGSGPDVEKVAKAVEIARGMRPDLLVEGPIQYDAAVDPEVARTKVTGDNPVAGRASVLIVPSLSVGNVVYKAVQQSTGAIAIGPVLQGLTRPVNDLSRGCTVGDIINTIACTAVQAATRKAAAGPAPPGAAAAAAA